MVLNGNLLIRQSLELSLKALLCRVYSRKRDVQDAFEECCHDLSMLFQKYNDTDIEKYLNNNEEEWLTKYFASLEEVDKKSDMFRFPFEDDFLLKYRDKFLDNVDVANNMLQAFSLIKKCIEKGNIEKDVEFNGDLQPEFLYLHHMELEIVICGKEYQTKAFMLKLRDIAK